MTQKRTAEIGAIFNAALETAPDRRAAFLQNACGGDEALRLEVERRLAESDHRPPSRGSSPANDAIPAAVDDA